MEEFRGKEDDLKPEETGSGLEGEGLGGDGEKVSLFELKKKRILREFISVLRNLDG
jgi:hypothetical protein